MSLYELTSEELRSFEPQEAVRFVRKLLWAEARRVGVNSTLINVQDKVFESDGGIDALIDEADPSDDELIPEGLSGFQIKAGDLTGSEIEDEIFQDGDPSGPLKERIQRLVENGGTYVLFLLTSLTEEKLENREDALESYFGPDGYRLLTADNLPPLVNQFPGLVISYKPEHLAVLPFDKWGERGDIGGGPEFVADEEREEKIESLRRVFRAGNGNEPIRVKGLSGVGKTRFTYESLNVRDLRQDVVYAPSAEDLLGSEFLNAVQVDGQLQGTIVVDDCGPRHHERLEAALGGHHDRIKLITISHQRDELGGGIREIDLQPLDEDAIREILQKELDEEDYEVTPIVQFSDGFPEVAVLIIKSLRRQEIDGDVDLLSMGKQDFINRLLQGEEDLGSDWFQDKRTVMERLSLFERVGFKGENRGEAEWLRQRTGVDQPRFNRIIQEQKAQGVLRGEYFLYLRPFPLAIHLVDSWFDSFGGDVEFLYGFLESIPGEFQGDMVPRFLSRFRYIGETDAGREVTERLLADDGPFQDPEVLEWGTAAQFFRYLTEAAPRRGLERLEGLLDQWSRDRLQNFESGRRQIIPALERIVVWDPLFKRGARILRELAAAENETWANNATGVYSGLFPPAPRELSPTEADLEDRIDLLQEGLNSGDERLQEISLEAAEAALETRFFSRSVGPEYQGTRLAPDLWEPESGDEVAEYYRGVWSAVRRVARSEEGPIREKATEVLTSRARGVAALNTEFSRMVRDTFSSFLEVGVGDIGKIQKAIANVVEYEQDNLSDDEVNQWANLEERATEDGLERALRRHVGLSLVQDRLDDSVDLDEKIEALAGEAISNREDLEDQFSWLVDVQNSRAQAFGRNLAQEDSDRELLSSILEAIRQRQEPSLALLNGYLSAIRERNPEAWNEILSRIWEDPLLREFHSSVATSSRMTQDVAETLLERCHSGEAGSDDIEKLRAYPIAILPDQLYSRWVAHLTQRGDLEGPSLALRIVGLRVRNDEAGDPFPPESDWIIPLLSHDELWREGGNANLPMGVGYEWKRVADAAIEEGRETSKDILEGIMGQLGEGTLYTSGREAIEEFLFETAREAPEAFWEVAKSYLDPEITRTGFRILSFLGGKGAAPEEPAAFSWLPKEAILGWVDEDPEALAPLLSRFVPLELDEYPDSVAWELLSRYGNLERVRREASANFTSVGGFGPLSSRYENLQDEVEALKEEVDDGNIQRWLREVGDDLSRSKERSQAWEEREGIR